MEATQVFQAPVRLMPMTVSHTAGVTSSQRWMVHTPALATAMSSRPSRSTPVADGGRQCLGVAHVRPAPPPCGRRRPRTSRAVSSRSAGVASG